MGVEVEACVGVRLGGMVVGVEDGIGVKVDEGEGVGFSVGGILVRVTVGVGLREGIKVRHASRIKIIGSKTRERGLAFINNNAEG